MKFDPTWRQVALLGLLLSAVIVTHVWAPLAISAITSIASTIVGALFVNLPSKHPPEPEAPPTPRPSHLRLVPKEETDGGEQ